MTRARRYGDWILGERLGSGGNGLVFAATRGDEVGAIKLLRKSGASRRARFADEISAMRRCMDIPGVLPILDSSDLAGAVDGPAWFAMAAPPPFRTRSQVAGPCDRSSMPSEKSQRRSRQCMPEAFAPETLSRKTYFSTKRDGRWAILASQSLQESLIRQRSVSGWVLSTT